jgi:hypothetical protein
MSIEGLNIPEGIIGNFFLLDRDPGSESPKSKYYYPHFFVFSIEDGGTDYELGSGSNFNSYFKVKLYKFEIGTEKVIEVTRFHTKKTLSDLTKQPLSIEDLEKIKNEYK